MLEFCRLELAEGNRLRNTQEFGHLFVELLKAVNWPQWESLYYRDWHTLQGKTLFFSPCRVTFLAHCWIWRSCRRSHGPDLEKLNRRFGWNCRNHGTTCVWNQQMSTPYGDSHNKLKENCSSKLLACILYCEGCYALVFYPIHYHHACSHPKDHTTFK